MLLIQDDGNALFTAWQYHLIYLYVKSPYVEFSITDRNSSHPTTNKATLSNSKQIKVLTNEHNKRLAELQVRLLKDEEESINDAHIPSTQQRFINAAERIRDSIKQENESYQRHLEQLMKIADKSE